LEEIFRKLNVRYFGGEIASARLGWSPHRSRSILGHYDSAHGTITVSRWFDSPSVPRYLVEYLVFHEMLHIRFPVERNGHRRVVHSRAFREAEKGFPHYEKARRRLAQMAQ
jgi:predicted metal-dependent hydrolase